MTLFDQAQKELQSVRDLMRFAVSRFNEANVFFGHGSDNAWDEAAYLILHTLHLPPDRLDPYIDTRLTHDERSAKRGNRSVLRLRGLAVQRREIFLDVRRHRLVVRELDGKRSLARRHRLQTCLVVA